MDSRHPREQPALDLAKAFSAMRRLGVARREAYSDLLRETMDSNATFFAAWSVWEPDAVGGRDQQFRHHPGHDGTGRFVPFWHRRHGYPKLDPVTGYDDPAESEWFLEPKRQREVRSIDPYLYPVGGSRCLIASQVAPILLEGVCLGVAGVDFWVEEIAEQAIRNSPRRFAAEEDPVEEILDRGFMVVDPEGEILHWTQRTVGLLSRYVQRLTADTRRMPEQLGALTRPRFSDGRRESAAASPALRITRIPLRQRAESLLVVSERKEARLDLLTRREREVHHWLCEGKTNDEIGTILGISPHTVKNHLEKVYAKLGVENRLAATRVA